MKPQNFEGDHERFWVIWLHYLANAEEMSDRNCWLVGMATTFTLRDHDWRPSSQVPDWGTAKWLSKTRLMTQLRSPAAGGHTWAGPHGIQPFLWVCLILVVYGPGEHCLHWIQAIYDSNTSRARNTSARFSLPKRDQVSMSGHKEKCKKTKMF